VPARVCALLVDQKERDALARKEDAYARNAPTKPTPRSVLVRPLVTLVDVKQAERHATVLREKFFSFACQMNFELYFAYI